MESASPTVCLNQSLRGAHNITVYDLKNHENCKLVYRLISNKYPSLLHVNIAEALFKRSGKTAFKVTPPSFLGGVPSYFEALWYPHLYFYRKSNT